MMLEPLKMRVLTPEEREARDFAIKKAKAAAQKAAKVRPLKKNKK
jgi:hypothetical protein